MIAVIDLISSLYGRESPLTVTRGKVQKYLGMIIDLSKKGKIKFTLYDYISDMLKELLVDTNKGEAEKPAGDHLLTINKGNTENMSKYDTIKFHHVTSKMLLLDNRDRPYL